MHKRDIHLHYRNMSAEDQRAFDRWLKVNLVLTSFVAVGLLAMALTSSGALSPRTAVAKNEFDIVRPSERVKSAHELMSRVTPLLPVEQVDEPF